MPRFVPVAARWRLGGPIRAPRPPWQYPEAGHSPPAQAGHVAHKTNSQDRQSSHQRTSAGVDQEARVPAQAALPHPGGPSRAVAIKSATRAMACLRSRTRLPASCSSNPRQGHVWITTRLQRPSSQFSSSEGRGGPPRIRFGSPRCRTFAGTEYSDPDPRIARDRRSHPGFRSCFSGGWADNGPSVAAGGRRFHGPRCFRVGGAGRCWSAGVGQEGEPVQDGGQEPWPGRRAWVTIRAGTQISWRWSWAMVARPRPLPESRPHSSCSQADMAQASSAAHIHMVFTCGFLRAGAAGRRRVWRRG